MALYNEILVGRFNRFLQKHLGMKGGPPSPQLAGDIQPQLALHSDNENFYLEGWESFGVAPLQVAGGLILNEIRLRNPTTSNVVALLQMIRVTANAVCRYDLQYGQPGADLPTAQTVRSLDTRGRPASSLICTTDQPAAQSQIGQNIGSAFLAANNSLDWVVTEEQRIVLLPGSALQLSCQTVNTTTIPTLHWRERYLEEGERT